MADDGANGGHFDMAVIGAGPAGERASILAARAGRHVALVEKEHVVGGARVNWGTIPSKTLRESALFVHTLTATRLDAIQYAMPAEISIGDFMSRERRVVKRELELINKALGKYAVTLLRGHARFEDPHTLALTATDGHVTRITADVIVIATGSSPNHPADVVFDMDVVFDSTTVLWLPRMPKSMVVLGAGVIGVEYAAIFGALGLDMTLVDTRERLLPYLDYETIDILEREMTSRLGVRMVHNDHYARIEKLPGDPPRVRCTLRSGAVLEADVLLYCVGRDGNTGQLGLETIGLQPNARGLIAVNGNFQTALPHVYAVGDVIGYPALASTSMEQGRQAVRHAFDIPGPRGQTELMPFAIYAIPEVSYIGPTEEDLRKDGVDYVVGRGLYELNARGQIAGSTGGQLKLLFRKGDLKLLAVHIVGHNASELVHIGQAFLKCCADANTIAETLFNYPTLSDMYRHAALEAVIKGR